MSVLVPSASKATVPLVTTERCHAPSSGASPDCAEGVKVTWRPDSVTSTRYVAAAGPPPPTYFAV